MAESKARIGVVGCGRMGLAMVKHLLRHGHPVTVTDISAEQVRLAVAAGAASAPTPAELGKSCDFVIIAVGYDAEALEVANGLMTTLRPGSLVALSSTCAPETAEHLAKLGAARQIEIFDAPICRGRRAADDGTLLAVVGASETVFARGRTVYACFCSDIIHIGPVGHGQIAKAINNLVPWVNGLTLIEAGRICEAFGVNLPKLREAMLISTGKSGALEGWSTMSFTWALKDMQIVSRMTDRANVGAPLTGAVRELVKEGRKIKQTNPPDWTGTGTDLS